MPNTTNNKLIHIAKLEYSKRGVTPLLLLRETGEHKFTWYFEKERGMEEETSVEGSTIEEAMRLAHKKWKNTGFTTIKCGLLGHLVGIYQYLWGDLQVGRGPFSLDMPSFGEFHGSPYSRQYKPQTSQQSN